jgi:hypothetical protein
MERPGLAQQVDLPADAGAGHALVRFMRRLGQEKLLWPGPAMPAAQPLDDAPQREAGMDPPRHQPQRVVSAVVVLAGDEQPRLGQRADFKGERVVGAVHPRFLPEGLAGTEARFLTLSY